MKFRAHYAALKVRCRAPRGARGLKCPYRRVGYALYLSCPSRGTWIEIMSCPGIYAAYIVVPLAGHVD